MRAYDVAMAHARDTVALEMIAQRLEWDQETMMPPGAETQRGDERAALEAVLHARRTDRGAFDWVTMAKPETEAEAAQLRVLRHSFRRHTAVPQTLAIGLKRETSMGQGVWARARAAEDWAAFAPTLERIVRLQREEGEALAEAGLGATPYEALLQDYEPGATVAEIETTFATLRSGLVALRDRILGSDVVVPDLDHDFPEERQLALAREMALTFGYDFAHGRLDKAVHPFSSGAGLDVRITTRTAPRNPFNCIYSTIHEVGHAAYEQNVARDYLLTPIGRGASMGVHESQSRIYENQIGRSEAFCGFLYRRMADHFGAFGIDDARAFARVVNRVHPGPIRTESDEVHYNLHIMMRFDLERALIAGDLAVADLPDAWNARFEQDFGVTVDRPSNGVLQDVHWSVGLFGYFPTYTLGNVYAGCLHEALRAAVPDLDADLARGETGAATAWLRDALQQHGALRTPRETIAHATGAEPGPEPLLRYLDRKFSALYGPA